MAKSKEEKMTLDKAATLLKEAFQKQNVALDTAVIKKVLKDDKLLSVCSSACILFLRL